MCYINSVHLTRSRNETLCKGTGATAEALKRR